MSLLAHILMTSGIVIVLAMLALWLVGTMLRDVSIADPFWGAGFVIVAGVAWHMSSGAGLRVVLLAILSALWGLRLSLFLLWRKHGHAEDRRYAAMRTYHGRRFWWVSLFTVFLMQGAILWFVSLPIQVALACDRARPLGWFDAVGIALWGIGLFFEAVGDWQLARFKFDPLNVGKVMDRGLWRLTRHPNYFGDFCVWWGLYLVAAAGGAAWTIASPLLMSFLLLKVSGVTLLERTIVDRRPDYAEYQAQTNAFFPWPPSAR